MTALVLSRSNVAEMTWHMALYGLGGIVEDAGAQRVRTRWTSGMMPRAAVEADGTDEVGIADMVRSHAAAHSGGSWLDEDFKLRGTARGLMSPRLATMDAADFRLLQARRHEVLDRITEEQSWLDLRMLAGMGEPAYWSTNPKGDVLQDDGASRWDMQPRNQGSEIVKNRLRKLAQTLSVRSPAAVCAGLTGDAADGVNAPGLLTASSSDSAVAWCALWGMSQLPIAAKVNTTARTTGHIGKTRQEWYYAPYWESPWTPSRLRSVLASAALKTAACADLPKRWAAADSELLAARSWLAARGVAGVVRFPIDRFGSDSAPERRAMLGRPQRTTLS